MIYQVLYAEDVPHYGVVEIEALSAEEALALAQARDYDNAYLEPDWSNGVCRRIVEICDDAGEILGQDISLDSCFLRYGGEPDRLRCQAAEDLLRVAKHVNAALTDLGIDLDGEDEALIAGLRIELDDVIEKAEGRGNHAADDQPSLF